MIPSLNALGQLRDRLSAAAVLARRGMVDPVRPDQALRAFVAMRRYGAFGGLIAYTAARYGDAPAITDEDGTITFCELAGHHPNSLRGRASQVNGGGPAVSRFDRDRDHPGEFAAGQHPQP